MRILLDECVPWPIQKLLGGHECVTVKQRGWMGIKNGDLLGLAEGEFDLFVTSDQSLRYQGKALREPRSLEGLEGSRRKTLEILGVLGDFAVLWIQ